MPNRNLQQQIDLVMGNVRGITAEQGTKIALLCLDAEAQGGNSSVWHNSARFFGTQCNCAPCHRARSVAA